MKPSFQRLLRPLKRPSARLSRPHLAAAGVAFLAACAAISGDVPQIDGARALEHAREITRHGPHPPGSEAQTRVGLYLVEQLTSYGLEVRTDAFTASTPLGNREMVNIWGVLAGRSSEAILIASHYDSKYFEEFRFLGANDGAASSGIVLEMARTLAPKPMQYSLWFVFFDGEEAFGEWSSSDGIYGSRRFVDKLRRSSDLNEVRAMILLDLVGAEDVRLYRESNSTDWLKSIVWEQAAAMGHDRIFAPEGYTAAEDDHMPFIRAGIPAIDIIDLRYAHWHRPTDTLDKLSAPNMAVVGNVVLASLPKPLAT